MRALLPFAKPKLGIDVQPPGSLRHAVDDLIGFPQRPLRKLQPVVVTALRRADEVDDDYREGDRDDGYPMPPAPGQKDDAEDKPDGGKNHRQEIAADHQWRACLPAGALPGFGVTACGWLCDPLLHLRWSSRYRTSMNDAAASTPRWFSVLTWLPVLLVVAAVVAAGVGSEAGANLLGLFAGLLWLGNGVMLWRAVKNQDAPSVCVSRRRGWVISAPVLAVNFTLIGILGTISNIVRLA